MPSVLQIPLAWGCMTRFLLEAFAKTCYKAQDYTSVFLHKDTTLTILTYGRCLCKIFYKVVVVLGLYFMSAEALIIRVEMFACSTMCTLEGSVCFSLEHSTLPEWQTV